MSYFFEYKRYEHPHFSPKSILWEGDELVDWVQGGHRFLGDGSFKRGEWYLPYHFDAVAGSTSSRCFVVYTRNQTKGLVFREGKFLRQINRDYYHAGVYEYPVAVCSTPAGQEVLIHCPEGYNKISVESVDTGTSIWDAEPPEDSADFFHAKFLISPDSKYLVSLGWVWHPWMTVCVFDFEAAMKDPNVLHGHGLKVPVDWEVLSACFVSDNQPLLGCFDQDEECSYALRRWTIGSDECEQEVLTKTHAGQMMPINERFVVLFYEYPKIFDTKSGDVVYEWKEIPSGVWSGCMDLEEEAHRVAIDRRNCRFAVFDNKGVHVVRINRAHFDRELA